MNLGKVRHHFTKTSIRMFITEAQREEMDHMSYINSEDPDHT